jgi:hypothetical protein
LGSKWIKIAPCFFLVVAADLRAAAGVCLTVQVVGFLSGAPG